MRIGMTCWNKACGWTFEIDIQPDTLVVQHETCPKCRAVQDRYPRLNIDPTCSCRGKRTGFGFGPESDAETKRAEALIAEMLKLPEREPDTREMILRAVRNV